MLQFKFPLCLWIVHKGEEIKVGSKRKKVYKLYTTRCSVKSGSGSI